VSLGIENPATKPVWDGWAHTSPGLIFLVVYQEGPSQVSRSLLSCQNLAWEAFRKAFKRLSIFMSSSVAESYSLAFSLVHSRGKKGGGSEISLVNGLHLGDAYQAVYCPSLLRLQIAAFAPHVFP
jgi:hypothetical protein